MREISQRVPKLLFWRMSLKIKYLKLLLHLPGTNELGCCCWHCTFAIALCSPAVGSKRVNSYDGNNEMFQHGPLTRYAKLPVAHAPGMPGTFSSPLWVSDPDMHHGTCVTHVPWCMPGLLTSGLLWSQWRGKRSRHSRCMSNSQFYVSGKRSIEQDFPGRSNGYIYD